MAPESDKWQSSAGFQAVEQWLVGYFAGKGVDTVKEKVLDKIKEKIARKLGCNGFLEIIGGNFPAAKLAGFGSSILKGIWYEGYYIANGVNLWNPNDPSDKDKQDAYVEYLLYSWGRYLLDLKLNSDPSKRVVGGPGYIYFKLTW